MSDAADAAGAAGAADAAGKIFEKYNSLLETKRYMTVGSWTPCKIGDCLRIHLANHHYVECVVIGKGTAEEYLADYKQFGVGESNLEGKEDAYFYKVTAE